MPKISIKIIPSIILTLIVSSLFSVQSVSAANCSFIYDPSTPNQNMNAIKVTLSSNDISSGVYNLILFRANNSRDDRNHDLNFTTGQALTVEFQKPVDSGWLTGTYQLYLVPQGRIGQPWDNAVCSSTFNVRAAVVQDCTVSIPTRPIDPDTEVDLEVQNLQTGDYEIFLNDQKYSNYNPTQGRSVNLGKHNVGKYIVSIKNNCGLVGQDCWSHPPRLQCPLTAFEVAPKGSNGGGEIPPPGTGGGGPGGCTSDCTRSGGDACNTGTGNKVDANDPSANGTLTAIGCIPSDPKDLIPGFAKFITGAAGGVAVLLMIYGAFQMITSGGNPDTLKDGQQRMVAAGAGLLFIILAVLIMRIVGFDILNLPGFTK